MISVCKCLVTFEIVTFFAAFLPCGISAKLCPVLYFATLCCLNSRHCGHSSTSRTSWVWFWSLHMAATCGKALMSPTLLAITLQASGLLSAGVSHLWGFFSSRCSSDLNIYFKEYKQQFLFRQVPVQPWWQSLLITRLQFYLVILWHTFMFVGKEPPKQQAFIKAWKNVYQ